MNFLSQIFSGIGQGIVGDLSTVENYALDAFYIIAGLLTLIAVLIGAILVWGVAVSK